MVVDLTSHLLAYIMILGMISHLDLQDLPIHDVWSMLLNGMYLSGAFIPNFDGHFNIDEPARVDVFCLQ